MSDQNENENDEDDKIISLDDLESMEQAREHKDDPCYNEDDWGDSYDDLDSEVWEKQYRRKEETETEPEPEPWELE